jgi:hypothetical protein
MYQQVQAGARFFLTYDPAPQSTVAQSRSPVVEEQEPRQAMPRVPWARHPPLGIATVT